jgi:predicted lipoprotein with Yx(FWY)xxD motif
MKLVRRAALAATCVLLAACAGPTSTANAPPPPATVVDGVLVGPSGMTLYTFKEDGARVSVCNDACAKNWPPFRPAADAKDGPDYRVIRRLDGSYQWAYRDAPLYYWVRDQKPGDKTGDGFNQRWWAAKP